MIACLRRLTPLALAVMVLQILILLGIHPSRIGLLLSGEVPAWRMAAMAALIIVLGYIGAASIRRDLMRDARKSRRR